MNERYYQLQSGPARIKSKLARRPPAYIVNDGEAQHDMRWRTRRNQHGSPRGQTHARYGAVLMTESRRFSAGHDTVGDAAEVARAPPLTFLIPGHFSVTSPLAQTSLSTAFCSLYIISVLLICFDHFKTNNTVKYKGLNTRAARYIQ
jgi:hypothetical protein